jgi:hypothetical protein
MEVVAQLRVASILFLVVVVRMHWLAGNTHKLSHHQWAEPSMSWDIDILYIAFAKIPDNGSFF